LLGNARLSARVAEPRPRAELTIARRPAHHRANEYAVVCNQYEHAYAFSYRRPSCRSSSMEAPEIVPSNSPVFVKSWAPPEALNNTGLNAAVNVSVPEASWKRPVPPVIL